MIEEGWALLAIDPKSADGRHLVIEARTILDDLLRVNPTFAYAKQVRGVADALLQ
jgi:hypothetical protein